MKEKLQRNNISNNCMNGLKYNMRAVTVISFLQCNLCVKLYHRLYSQHSTGKLCTAIVDKPRPLFTQIQSCSLKIMRVNIMSSNRIEYKTTTKNWKRQRRCVTLEEVLTRVEISKKKLTPGSEQQHQHFKKMNNIWK